MHSPVETRREAASARSDSYARRIRITSRESRTVFINSTEAYLYALYAAHEEGSLPNRHSMSRRLDITRSAAGQMIDRMVRDGLVETFETNTLYLTRNGTARAIAIVRKHRLAERLLVDVVGLDWELAHQEASRWQHVLGEDVERNLLGLLDNPQVSPFGCPIPGLDLLNPSMKPSDDEIRNPRTITEMARLGIQDGIVSRICERLQDDMAAMRDLRRGGLLPGRAVAIEPARSPGEEIRVVSEAGTLAITAFAAGLIVVECAMSSVAVPEPARQDRN